MPGPVRVLLLGTLLLTHAVGAVFLDTVCIINTGNCIINTGNYILKWLLLAAADSVLACVPALECRLLADLQVHACALQVGSLTMTADFNKHFEDFFRFFMQSLQVIVPPTVNLPEA